MIGEMIGNLLCLTSALLFIVGFLLAIVWAREPMWIDPELEAYMEEEKRKG